jgi:hypothetical protein
MVAGVAHGVTAKILVAGLVLGAGCEVRGVIGSNLGPAGDAAGASDGHDDADGSTGTGTPASSGGADEGGASHGAGTSGGAAEGDTYLDVVFDVGVPDAPDICPASALPACDIVSSDPWNALGINCPGGPTAEATIAGHPLAWQVHEGQLGTHGYFTPREGDRMVILSTGLAAEVALPRDQLCPTCPSTDFGQATIPVLPDPIDVRRVDDVATCADDPTLIGTGDCSNTLEEEWTAGSGAHDYIEMRMLAEVPPAYDAFRYRFAFFSTEYPAWFHHGSPWNDMYLAWLESESWTGNVSFDEAGNPISINGVLLDFRDAEAEGCPAPCEAPELAGFAMEGHAGTRWLETTAPVVPGETIELVFALFDLTDGSYDSVVVLDDWDWTCGGDLPITVPAG